MKKTVADRTILLLGAIAWGVSTQAMPAQAGDLEFSDPRNVSAPPDGAIGFPNREPDFDVLPGFQNPPPGYGEVAFYWWLGDPLTKDRLLWQLDQLAGKRVMGLQINYAHSDRGGQSYGLTYPSDPPLFSDAWWELVGWFMQQAKQRGMAVSLSDYTLGIGQGWSVDDLLKEHPEMIGSVLQSQTREVDGAFVDWTLPPHTLTVAAYPESAGEAIALRRFVQDDRLQWQAPHGKHRVVAVYVLQVQPSLDPLHPDSGTAYAAEFFGQFEEHNPTEGGRGLNFFFSDELGFGVGGKLWTARFAEQFRLRKGYDLVPELPALFTDVGSRTPKVRLDYSDVKVALTEEGFFEPVFDWHQKRGMIYGCDHGGRGRNVTEFGDYFRTQRWNQGPGCDQPKLGRDIIKNKVASSIAHLYQRPRVWLEGFYGSGWGTSSADLTDATFANFVQGQNLLTLHGLYYSTHGGYWEWAPPCNHFRMPYWKHIDRFMQCTERLSFLLSQGYHRCDVAVMYPVAPTEAGVGGPQSVEAAFDAGRHLYEQGIDFDYMDFESLARSEIIDGQLHVAGEQYRAVVLPAMRALRWSTLEKAVQFQRAGGLVVVQGALPEASDRAGRDDAQLAALVAELTTRANTLQQVTSIVEQAFIRDYTGPGYVMHRRIGTRDLYAIYNAPAAAECRFRAVGNVELWDPWTGRTQPLPVESQDATSTTLRLPLSEKEVQLIVFQPGQAELAKTVDGRAMPQLVKLDGEWEFELQPTLDNRFGDFRWPPTANLIRAEARRFRYADEAEADPGWQQPDFDDAQWTLATHAFGPRFWKLGPLPADAEFDAQQPLDPTVGVVAGNRTYAWMPYEFSWRWGIPGDPGHQGYHGLKEEVHDEFIGLGKLQLTGTGTRYQVEPEGQRYYLYSSVVAPRAGTYWPLIGGLKPSSVWVNGQMQRPIDQPVDLQAGGNSLLLRYDAPGAGYYVVSKQPAEMAPLEVQPLASRWHNNTSVLPFDTRPQVRQPAGWYRFTSPPGLRAMTITALGDVQVWADGKPLTAVGEGRFVVSQPIAAPVKVAVRIVQQRGCYGGAALPEPIKLECGPGSLAPGDWSQIDGLESYSGGAWYRRTVRMDASQASGSAVLDLGNVVASAEVHVNGQLAGIRVAPPWKVDISPYLTPGDNRIEILVYNTLANHYLTIPTRYRGSSTSGLLGPVRLETGASRK